MFPLQLPSSNNWILKIRCPRAITNNSIKNSSFLEGKLEPPTVPNTVFLASAPQTQLLTAAHFQNFNPWWSHSPTTSAAFLPKSLNKKNKSMETGAWHGTTYLPPSTLEAEADQLGNVL